jgi:large subunit ribosomal protein L27e
MGKFLKQGKVVILLTGRYAGKKAVIVKTFDNGSATRKFPHVLVAGLEKTPLFVTKKMNEKKVERRLRVKPFVKYVNLQHIIPTRYNVTNAEIEFKTLVTDEKMTDVASRKALRKELRNVLSAKYAGQAVTKKGDKANTPGFQFFYSKLRF